MSLTQAEQEELNQLRQELGYGPLGEPLVGVSTPTYTPEATKKTFKELAADVAPMLGATVAPLFGPSGIAVRAGLSALGAGAGTGVKQGIQTYGLNQPWSPEKMVREYPVEMLTGAGGEIGGQLIGRGVARGVSALRETPLAQRLMGPTTAKAEELATRQEIQQLLQKQGTTLGIQEAAPGSVLAKTTERLARIGPTKAAQAKDIEFKNALTKEVDQLADELTTDVFSREQIGDALKTAKYEGKNALYDSYGTKLEELLTENMGAKVLPTVDMTPLQKAAQDRLNKAAALTKSGKDATQFLGSKGTSEAESIINLKPEMTFAEANEARRLLLQKQRTYDTGTPEYSIIKDAIGQIQTQMDEGAKALSPDLYSKYQSLSSGYKEAIRDLDPKLFVNAANKSAESVADSIIKSKNPSEWKDTQALIARAKMLGVNTTGVTENIQRAYLERTFTDNGLTNIANKLKNDKAFAEQFNAVLPEGVKNRAITIAKAGQILAQRGQGVDLASAAAISGAAGGALGGVLGGADTGNIGGGAALGSLAGLVIAPQIAVRIAYSPRFTKKLLQASSEATKGNTAGALLKISEMYSDMKVSPADMQQKPTPGVQPAQPSTGLTPDEQAELEQLRKEIYTQ